MYFKYMYNKLQNSPLIILSVYDKSGFISCPQCAYSGTLYELNIPKYRAKKYIGDVRCEGCVDFSHREHRGKIILDVRKLRYFSDADRVAIYSPILAWLTLEKIMLMKCLVDQHNRDVSTIIANLLSAVHMSSV